MQFIYLFIFSVTYFFFIFFPWFVVVVMSVFFVLSQCQL